MRVLSENLANADSTAQQPGSDPFRRKIPTFRSEVDRSRLIQLMAGRDLAEMFPKTQATVGETVLRLRLYALKPGRHRPELGS